MRGISNWRFAVWLAITMLATMPAAWAQPNNDKAVKVLNYSRWPFRLFMDRTGDDQPSRQPRNFHRDGAAAKSKGDREVMVEGMWLQARTVIGVGVDSFYNGAWHRCVTLVARAGRSNANVREPSYFLRAVDTLKIGCDQGPYIWWRRSQDDIEIYMDPDKTTWGQ